MEPTIVNKPAFTVVGMRYHGKNENNEIPQLWGEFNPRTNEIKNMRNPQICYGVCDETVGEDGFTYIAGVEVDATDDLPENMISWDVPGGTFAVFPCTLKTIHETYEHAFGTWLPQSDYEHVKAPDYELYNEESSPEDGPDMKLYIYIPVRSKA